MNIAIINSSPEVYNLAVHKMANYYTEQGHKVSICSGSALFLPDIWYVDKACFSVIFTWDLPEMVRNVNLFLSRGIEVEIGGPAATAMPEYITKHCRGWFARIQMGLDERFEHQEGEYEAVFTSRGCPRGCHFCIVQKVEGRRMIEYNHFPIPVGSNPWVCDNNILATSWEHQQLVVERLKHVHNLDLNSGFDCRIFARDPEKYYYLYSRLQLERWRFAYDVEEEREPLKVCVDFLHSKGIKYQIISVFCLVGDIYQGDTFDKAKDRLQWLVDIGTSPYPMRHRPIDSLTRNHTPPGWDEKDVDTLFYYYGVPWHWRAYKWEDFRKNFWVQHQEERLL